VNAGHAAGTGRASGGGRVRARESGNGRARCACGRARPKATVGRNGGDDPLGRKTDFFFLFCFKFPFSNKKPYVNLNSKFLFLEHDPKIKVVQNFMLYNFA
jgi:hypothetical protein